MLLTPPRIALLLLISAQAVSSACTTDLDCSLNGVCESGSCTCDPAWQGERCSWLAFLPGNASGVGGQPLCVYHGQDANSTSWGGSVLHSPEDGLYWMWVAEMTNHCTLGQWRTNSEVALAKSTTPFSLLSLDVFATNDAFLPSKESFIPGLFVSTFWQYRNPPMGYG